MINPNDLRIGNYLQGIKIRIVSGFNKNEVMIGVGDEPMRPVPINQISPIFLTKNLATNLGFKQVSDTEFILQPNPLKSPKIKLTWYEFSDSTLDGFYFKIDHPYDVHVKYVHQIQNIVMDLLRIELKFKLPLKNEN